MIKLSKMPNCLFTINYTVKNNEGAIQKRLEKDVNMMLRFKVRLHLETSRSSSTSSSFELSTGRQDSWGLTLVRTSTEVSDSFSGLSWTSNDQSVLTLWSSNSQLVQSDTFTTSLQDSSSGTSSESQSSNGSLWEFENSGVVSDGTDNDNSLVSSTLLAQSSANSGDRDRRSVDLGQEQRLQDNSVEWSISTTY